jgi:hypothetical protein
MKKEQNKKNKKKKQKIKIILLQNSFVPRMLNLQ